MLRRAMSMPTADLCDEAGLDVSKIPSHPVKIVDPALNFKNFGGRREFSGQITTIKAYESNPAVKKAFAETGDGRVLVVVRTHPQSMFTPCPQPCAFLRLSLTTVHVPCRPAF